MKGRNQLEGVLQGNREGADEHFSYPGISSRRSRIVLFERRTVAETAQTSNFNWNHLHQGLHNLMILKLVRARFRSYLISLVVRRLRW